MAKLLLSPEERALPYAKYYDWPLEGQRPEDAIFLDTPLSPEDVLPIQRAADLLDLTCPSRGAANGWCVLPDGRVHTACTVFLPQVTVAMVDWWFEWLNHPPKSVPREQGNLRYKIWCPPDHWNHGFYDENDHDAGMRICESLDLGAGAPKQHIISKRADLMALGLSPEQLRALEAEGMSIKFGCGCDEHENPGGVGLNLFHNVPGGCEWTSRGWGGWAVDKDRLVALSPVPPADTGAIRMELLHNVLERRHLAKFLPQLYLEQKDKPFDED